MNSTAKLTKPCCIGWKLLGGGGPAKVAWTVVGGGPVELGKEGDDEDVGEGDEPDEDDDEEEDELLRRPKYRPSTRARMTAAMTRSSAMILTLDRCHGPWGG